MKSTPRFSTPQLWIILILAACAVVSFLANRSRPGDDLSSSYVGCRVLASHQPEHLYSRDPRSFNLVDDPVWQDIAARTGFPRDGILHPYVQTPLWGFALEPLCSQTGYRSFHAIFVALEAGCLALLLWLTVRYWSPLFFQTTLRNPAWVVLVALLFFASVPVRYALYLAQTHIFFVLLTLVALLCARRRPVMAGALLAIAATVKITPAFFLIYWLFTRQRRAALSFIGWSAALVLATVASTGSALFLTYLNNLHAASGLLLVSANNQSFPAWLMGYFYPPAETAAWHPFSMPAALKIATLALAFASAALGGYLDWNTDRDYQHDDPSHAPGQPGYGAIFALIGVTLFAPISWSHYYLILILPLMMMTDAHLRRRSLPLVVAVVTIILLNAVPHAPMQHRLHIVRPQFYSGIIALAGLALLQRRKSAAQDLELHTQSEAA